MSKVLKNNFFDVYIKSLNNAKDLLCEAKILFDNGKHARAYFLAFTSLEEVSKSQLAADVYTGIKTEDYFFKIYSEHKDKLNNIEWAYFDANSRPYNLILDGQDINDAIEIKNTKMPSYQKRLRSLYVDVMENKVINPNNEITKEDANEIIHISEIAIYRIFEVTELNGNQIGTKGFMK